MTLVWVICGAGRRVGKTHLARELCAVLPRAVHAKQGRGPRKPGKPEHLFPTADDLTVFIAEHRAQHEHILVESNELARAGAGDITLFVEGAAQRTNLREDADLLRSKADVCVGPTASPGEWSAVLRARLQSDELCAAVCAVLEAHQKYQRAADASLWRVEPVRVSTDGSRPVRDPSQVVVEQLLTIMIEGVGNFAVMCTPCDVEALAVGFAHSEGLISSPDDVISLSYRQDQNAVALRIEAPAAGAPQRNLIVTSSCGLCGSRNIDRLLTGGVASPNTLRVPPATLHVAAQQMQARQSLFAQTGGTHAAGVFSAAGELIAFAEDIGRHNALDKAVGRCLLDGVPLRGRGAALSSRVSLEMVAKAARAGFEIMAAVSAPSSLAIQAAEKCNITLCAFVREDRATVYTHPRRIAGLDRAD